MKKTFLRDGHHYDARYASFVEDISFFVDLIKDYGDPVLELGCGTGRVTLPLAREGFSVTGLDVSFRMLERGKEKAQKEGVRITWHQADWRSFQMEERFTTIIFPFNSISLLLHYEDLEASLEAVRKHLIPSGHFIISLFNPSLTILSRDRKVYHPLTTYEDPEGKGEVTVYESTFYDKATQILHVNMRYHLEEKEWEEELLMRIYFPEELKALLYFNGFEIGQCYGDFHRSPFSSNSPHQILICKPK